MKTKTWIEVNEVCRKYWEDRWTWVTGDPNHQHNAKVFGSFSKAHPFNTSGEISYGELSKRARTYIENIEYTMIDAIEHADDVNTGMLKELEVAACAIGLGDDASKGFIREEPVVVGKMDRVKEFKGIDWYAIANDLHEAARRKEDYFSPGVKRILTMADERDQADQDG